MAAADEPAGIFTPAEEAFLAGARLGRIATASREGVPDVAPVGFAVVDGEVRVGGMDLPRTRKYHNVLANGQASFVVDDLASVDPWRPRGVKVTGPARIEGEGRQSVIHLTPTTVWSWGLNQGAERVFGPIEKREIG
jgi:pyridoxamine 5'-phosphate oxidase family protein